MYFRPITLFPRLFVLLALLGLAACGGGGGSSAGSGGGTDTSPGAPQNVVAVANGLQVDLSWDAVDNADGYSIYWHDNGVTSNSWTLLQSVTTTSFSHTGLTSYTTYSYRITASANSQEGSSSAEVSATPAPPSAPQNLAVIANGLQMNLSWDTVANADSYNIYWHDSGATTADWTLLQSVTGSSFSHTNLSAGVSYSYRVTATINSQESDPSQTVNATTPPGIPQNLVALAAGGVQVNLSWDAVSKADSYSIYWHDNGTTTSNWTLLQSVTTTSFSHTGLSSSTTYSYRITASTNSQEGNPSAEVSVTPALPAAPQNLTAVANGLQVDLSWDAVANADSYNVYWHDYGTTTANWTLLQSVAGTSFSHSNLDGGVTYSYRVTVIVTSQESDPSQTVNATTLPGTPQNLVAVAASGAQVDLSWNAVNNAGSYNIYWHDNGTTTSDWTLLQTITGTSFSHTGLTGGVTYSYRVSAIISQEGDTSASASVVTPPAAPQNATATARGAQVDLTWDSVSNADGYNIYWHDNGASTSNWTLLQSVASTSFSHTGLANGISYTYRISATTQAVVGDPSAEVNAAIFTLINQGLGGNVHTFIRAADGSGDVYVGGNFSSYNGTEVNDIIRLNSDGSIDTDFDVGAGFDSSGVNVIVPATDGSGDLYVGGYFTTLNGSASGRIVRLNSDGSVDADFNVGTGFNNSVYTMALDDTSGDLYVGGYFTNYNGTDINHIVRLNSDGSVDSGFNVGTGFNYQVNAIALDSNGALYVGGNFDSYNGVAKSRIIRLYSNGTIDSGFNTGSGFNSTAEALVLATDGSGDLYVGGQFNKYQGASHNHIIRLNSNGSVDTNFNTGTGFDSYVRDLAVAADGSGDIYAASAAFSSYNGTSVKDVVRLNSDGSIDTSFDKGTGFDGGVFAIYAIGNSGDVYIGGSFKNYNGSASSSIIHLGVDGAVVNAFSQRIALNGATRITVPAEDGSGDLYVGGVFSDYNGVAGNHIIRLNADGSVDAGFNVGTGFDNDVEVITLANDGSGDLYVGGRFTSYNGFSSNRIIRLNSDGSVDTSFNVGNGFSATYVQVLAMSNDGSGDLYVGGAFGRMNNVTYDGDSVYGLVRLNSDGSIDTAFNVGTGFDYGVRSLLMVRDNSGDVYVGGYFTDYNGTGVNRIVRLRSNGTINTGFAVGSGFDDTVNVLLYPSSGSGEFYVGGAFTSYKGVSRRRIIRLNSDGSEDTSFNTGTGFLDSSGVYCLALDSYSSDIYAGGYFHSYNGTASENIIRLNHNGSVDTGFAVGKGFDSTVNSISEALDASGKHYVGGYFNSYNGTTVQKIIALNPDGSVD